MTRKSWTSVGGVRPGSHAARDMVTQAGTGGPTGPLYNESKYQAQVLLPSLSSDIWHWQVTDCPPGSLSNGETTLLGQCHAG